MVSKIYIKGKQGKIAGLLQLPRLGDCDRCPMVVILHGIYDDKETPFIHALASELCSRGIGSLRIDFNGHGESEGAFLDMTVPLEIDDAKRAVDYVSSLKTTSSVSLMGHSQGGVVAGMLAGRLGEEKIYSLVLLAPAASLKDDCLNGCLFGYEFDANNVPVRVKNPWGYIGRKYIIENQKMQVYEETSKYYGPVCLIHGSADELVKVSYADRYAEILEDVSYHLLDGLDHYYDPRSKDAIDIAADFLEEIFS